MQRGFTMKEDKARAELRKLLALMSDDVPAYADDPGVARRLAVMLERGARRNQPIDFAGGRLTVSPVCESNRAAFGYLNKVAESVKYL